jgi:hypothetical protein
MKQRAAGENRTSEPEHPLADRKVPRGMNSPLRWTHSTSAESWTPGLSQAHGQGKSRTTNEWQQKTRALDGSGDKNRLSSKVLMRKRKLCLDQIRQQLRQGTFTNHYHEKGSSRNHKRMNTSIGKLKPRTKQLSHTISWSRKIQRLGTLTNTVAAQGPSPGGGRKSPRGIRENETGHCSRAGSRTWCAAHCEWKLRTDWELTDGAGFKNRRNHKAGLRSSGEQTQNNNKRKNQHT